MVIGITNEQERRTIVPTLVIGVGGTGLEVIMRLRRLVVESYGSLSALPILGFLHIDTDRDAQISGDKRRVAGPPLQEYEKFWAQVSLDNAQKIVSQPRNYSWFHEWLPKELIDNPGLLASKQGTGQFRPCSRFAFFCNHDEIYKKCLNAKAKITGHQDFMDSKYQLSVDKTQVNVFVVASISGGTGSGMLIDLGYCLHNWFANSVETAAIIPSPEAFNEVSNKPEFQYNGYAALMELNYYSSGFQPFNFKYGNNEGSRVNSQERPYDYVYLVGTQTGGIRPEQGIDLKLDDLREMIAQNIFLDLMSEFSFVKRSVRDNIKKQSQNKWDDPPDGRRSYPCTFMSLGMATIEVPIHSIRRSLASRLAADLFKWWQNEEVSLPAQFQKVVEDELRDMKLLGESLLAVILEATDRPYPDLVNYDLRNLQQQILFEKHLECTHQGFNMLGKETGKILGFLDFMRNKKEQYESLHFRDASPDQRDHGDYLQKMYSNSNLLVRGGREKLQEKLYTYLVDQNRGPRFLQSMLDQIEQIFNNQIQEFKTQIPQWQESMRGGEGKYTQATSKIDEHYKTYLPTKQDDMKKWCDEALEGVGQRHYAFLQYKSRAIAQDALQKLVQFISDLRERLLRWQQRVRESENRFQELATQETNQVDALRLVGVKLFQREELNDLYTDFLTYKQGLDTLCRQMTDSVLQETSPFWERVRPAKQLFSLLDLERIPQELYDDGDFDEIVAKVTAYLITNAPAGSKLASDMDACVRFARMYPSESARDAQIKLVISRSKPAVCLASLPPKQGKFKYDEAGRVGILGGSSTENPVAQKHVQIFNRYFNSSAIAPLAVQERHKIVVIHEVGQFSLRCIEGTERMRKAYQDWRGRRIKAAQEILTGRDTRLPTSIHMQDNFTVFWDFTPSDDAVERLVVINRAFEILHEERNPATEKNIICYYKINPIDRKSDRIIIAVDWEDAVQVLELPDCADDQREIETQLNQKVNQAKNIEQKQDLCQQLDTYLTDRLSELGGNTGERQYLREQEIIREFKRDRRLV